MKIVIDINEHLYKTIKTLGLVVEDEDAIAVSEAIRNGIPLESQPTEECEDNGSPWCLGYCPYRDTPQCPYEDTVYREEALKIIDNLSDLSYRWNIAKNLINNLPSVTPQIKSSEDCISREQAIKQCGFGMTSLLIADNLRRLPSVTPERLKGHWIHPYKSDIACECSECHIQMPITNYYHYCPNCGAEMSEDCGKQNL